MLGWLSEKLPTQKTLPPELRECALPVLSCVEDRSADVRKKAQEAIVPFMIHLGYNTFVKAAGKLKVGNPCDPFGKKRRDVCGLHQ